MAKKAKPQGKGLKKLIRVMWILFASGIIGIAFLFFLITVGAFGELPDRKDLENPKSYLASEIISADQEMLGKYYIENRSNLHFEDLPENIINALIATEDARFRNHSGVDLRALIRAIAHLGKAGGGSTLSQQTAKNLFPREDLNKAEFFIRKLKEWVLATQLEYHYTKEEIIAMYLNTVPFGMNNFGIKTAAKTYFGKDAIDLNTEESAVLVGMLKAPTYYNPILNPENSKRRREVVLKQMTKYGYLTQVEYDSLRVMDIDVSKYKRLDHNEGLATYLREYMRGQLKEWCKTHTKANGDTYNLYKDGLRIYTTIDSRMQRYAEEAVFEHLSGDLQPRFFKEWANKKRYPQAPFYRISKEQYEGIITQAIKRSERYRKLRKREDPPTMDEVNAIFDKPVKMSVFAYAGDIDTVLSPRDSILYYKHFLHTGMMSIEPQTGYVRAYVGGINYRHFKYDHVMVGKRQVGSTFKPFVYASAIQELGFTPCYKAPNIPVTFQMPDGQPDWTPKNSGDAREGEMVELKWALANSVNYISAYLMKRVGPQKVVELARHMGVRSDIQLVPAICLGTPSLSVEEMVGATATYVNKGVYSKPMFITRIEDKNGNVIEDFRSERHDAMSEETAYLMVELMRGVVQYGTGQRLRRKPYSFTTQTIGGKTGTTDNQSDGWFMGLTPELVTGVWVGAEDRSAHFRGIRYGQGAHMALPIFALYMQKVWGDKSINISQGPFERPEGFKVITDCNKVREQESAKQETTYDF